MSDVDKITIDNTTYNIKDSVARDKLPNLTKHTVTLTNKTIPANSTLGIVEHTAHNSSNVIISSISISGSYDVIPITWSYGPNDIYLNLRNINQTIDVTVRVTLTFITFD